jgi:uncharacterized protein
MNSGVPRIASIDVLRGIAVLGILLMNIQTFSMIGSAYVNPTSYGEFAGVNAVIWGFTRLFADQKFMTLFSMLFGAGIVLMSERAIADGRRAWAAHYRRMVVLLMVGLMHAYLLWYGDVLTSYAIMGMVVYWGRFWKPGVLLTVGMVLLIVPVLIFGGVQLFFDFYPPEVVQQFWDDWRPDEELVAWELSVYRGGYWGQMEHRAATALELHTIVLLMWFAWRVGGLMLIGMALFKWRILGAQRSPTFYWRMLLVGLGVGLMIEAIGMLYQTRGEWDVRVMIPGLLFNYFASLFTAAGYLGAVMLICQRGVWPKLQRKLSAVGRMAFTNYLTQTIICTTFFYGHGLGLFGYFERWEQLLFVIGVWGLQIVWSDMWLRRFNNGPLEWLWRCATYMRIMPLRKGEPSVVPLPPVLTGSS